MDITNVKQAVPFFVIASMDSSLNFYIKGLDFKLKRKWGPQGKIEWCWLNLDNASVMLQEYRHKPLDEKSGKGVSIYFICEDALTIYNRIISRKVPAAEPFVGNNMWIFWVKDPDGYNIFFESHTDVPEETTYSDWIRERR